MSAISERLLRLNPIRYITPKVPTRDRGTATLGMMVAPRLRKKRKITSTTSATASISSNCTSRTEARIVVVRSVRTETLTEGGKELWSWGKSLLIRSTTSMTLAPGCRWMFRITAGVSFIQAASLTFSTSSIASATSESWTGLASR